LVSRRQFRPAKHYSQSGPRTKVDSQRYVRLFCYSLNNLLLTHLLRRNYVVRYACALCDSDVSQCSRDPGSCFAAVFPPLNSFFETEGQARPASAGGAPTRCERLCLEVSYFVAGAGHGVWLMKISEDHTNAEESPLNAVNDQLSTVCDARTHVEQPGQGALFECAISAENCQETERVTGSHCRGPCTNWLTRTYREPAFWRRADQAGCGSWNKPSGRRNERVERRCADRASV
jgi:hypothetical protein